MIELRRAGALVGALRGVSLLGSSFGFFFFFFPAIFFFRAKSQPRISA